MSSDEMCPVCRSSTYLNPNMRFLVNSECYHKICESCVDRIFGSGPAPCPYRNCNKTLRRQRFKSQVFEDLRVEREVDSRQRVLKIYNAPASSFKTQREYDDFLEHVESLVFALSSDDPAEKEAADAEVRQYEATHKQQILETALALRAQAVADEEREQQRQEREQRLRLLARELVQQEKEFNKLAQEEGVAAMAAGQDADAALKEAADRAKQRTDLLRQQYDMETERLASLVRAAPSISQLGGIDSRTGEGAGAQTPFTPFAGDRDHYPFQQLAEYYDPPMSAISSDPSLRAGGFTAQYAEYAALACAFSSLDVDIQEEKLMNEQPSEQMV